LAVTHIGCANTPSGDFHAGKDDAGEVDAPRLEHSSGALQQKMLFTHEFG
jgi:hypothetical protein